MNPNLLTPSEKIAILMIFLGEELAAEIFRNMEPEDVRKVGTALARMKTIDQTTIDLVIAEFHDLLTSQRPPAKVGGIPFTKRVLDKAFPNSEFGQNLKASLRHGVVEMKSVELVDAETLARLLKREVPQTIALILAHTKADKSGQVLKSFPPSMRTDILTRIAQLQEVDPEVIEELDEHLRQEIDQIGLKVQKVGGIQKVASILNTLPNANELLDQIDERNPELSEDIRKQMFTFDDLVLLDDPGIRTLFQLIDKKTWSIALRGASESVKDSIFRNLSQRAAKLLAEDITAIGPQRLSDVKQAQELILTTARKLEEEGKIVIERSAEKKVV